MAHTVVTRQSWFSRIGGAFKGILIGIILVLVAFFVLFKNEGRAVQRHKTLQEGAGLAVSIDSKAVNEKNNGNLIHVSGLATTDVILTDSIFDISANAIHLKRNVEMYQWKENVHTETVTKTGGARETTKTYTYEKTWSKEPIDSSAFVDKEGGYVNPSVMLYKSDEWTAPVVTLGAFKLPDNLIGRIDDFANLTVSEENVVPENLGEKARVFDSGFYIGADPMAPEIGDFRVAFEVVYPTDISLIARQNGNTFEAFTTPKTKGTLLELKIGIFSKEAMFEAAEAANRTLTWILRLVGFFLFFIGFSMIFNPFKVIADVLPFMGKIVGAGVGAVSFLLALMLSFLVISFAWIFYRPLIGIPLLIVSVVLIIMVFKKIQNAKAPAPASTPVS